MVKTKELTVDEVSAIVADYWSSFLKASDPKALDNASRDENQAIFAATRSFSRKPVLETQILIFRETLKELIKKELQHPEFPECDLNFDYDPDVKLRSALDAADIRYSALPCKTSTFVEYLTYSGKWTIRASNGYGTPVVDLLAATQRH
jgi:hypothetical protein